MSQQQTSHHQAIAAWIFGLLFFAFLGVVFLVPFEVTVLRRLILALFAGLFAGVFAFFLGGSLTVEVDAEKDPLGRVGVRAAGGFGMFVLVFGAFLWLLGQSSSSMGSASRVTRDDLELLFARTLGVPDDYDFDERPLSGEVERLQQEMVGRLDEYAQPKMLALLGSVRAEEADRPHTKEDLGLEELIGRAEEEGRAHEISPDINLGGLWRTRPSDVGTDNVTTYRILQDQNGVRITHDHPQIGRTLSGRGVITGRVVRIWYRTIAGAAGELQLEVPGLVVGGRFDLRGRWDSGHGRRGAITLTRI